VFGGYGRMFADGKNIKKRTDLLISVNDGSVIWHFWRFKDIRKKPYTDIYTEQTSKI